MARALLVHWNEDELAERAQRLRDAGHEVHATSVALTPIHRVVALDPEVLVIDLGRLPSHGREVAMNVLQSKKTRHIAVVFVDGVPAKVARAKQQFPGATFVSWRGIRGGIARALRRPRAAAPLVEPAPRSPSGYSGTPLPKKLGIKAGMRVAILNAPDGFADTLGALPDDVTVLSVARGKRSLTLWFVTTRRMLARRIERLAAQVGDGGLWIVWPKKSSPLVTDQTPSQNEVRTAGLEAGLVDYKICAVDADWSGLKFSERRSGR